MNHKKEKYIDLDGQELSKKTWDDGDIWYTNKQGQLHRLDGPAKIYSNGTQIWYKDGKKYRLDGPAFISYSGYQAWYNYDKLHREDGPAVDDPGGFKAWYKDDLRHREDGPAVIWSNGKEEYRLNGEEVSKREVDVYWLKKQVQQ